MKYPNETKKDTIKVCIDISRCFNCPYNKHSVANPKRRCTALDNERYLKYEDIYERIPDWCPFRTNQEELNEF